MIPLRSQHCWVALKTNVVWVIRWLSANVGNSQIQPVRRQVGNTALDFLPPSDSGICVSGVSASGNASQRCHRRLRWSEDAVSSANQDIIRKLHRGNLLLEMMGSPQLEGKTAVSPASPEHLTLQHPAARAATPGECLASADELGGDLERCLRAEREPPRAL